MIYLILVLVLFLGGCTSSSTESISFDDGHCDFIEAHNFWASATAIPCFDNSGKIIGFGQSNGANPAAMWSSAANAAIITGALTGLTVK